MYNIDYIKKNYSIIDIAKRLGFEITKDNKSICPFHNDTNPSLHFNIKDNYFHCFSCGAGGDNIKLVMKTLNYDFKNAIEFIIGNSYKNIKKEKNIISYKNIEKHESINLLYSKIYETFLFLLKNDEAIKYLQNRRISKKQVIDNNIKNLPQERKLQLNIINELLRYYKEEDLIQSGIISKNNNLYLFHYRNRLIIPYFDINNNIISIQGRDIDGNSDTKFKYLFNKNAIDSIYHINKLSNDIKDIVICEGVIDCLSIERLGFQSIALSGATKSNTLKKYEKLQNYNIYSFSDNDNAGKKLIKDLCKLENYKGNFSISNFTKNKNIKDINEFLTKVDIKTVNINGQKYNFFEINNDKICILDYYIFTKKELKYIKEDFNKNIKALTIDKKTLSEKEYREKYGDFEIDR